MVIYLVGWIYNDIVSKYIHNGWYVKICALRATTNAAVAAS